MAVFKIVPTDQGLPMIDLTTVDQWFEIGREIGVPLDPHIFDRRVLLPLAQLPAAVEAEVGLTLTVEDLNARARRGWFPLLPRDDEPGDLGVPLYVPSRIGLLANLEKAGWSHDELRLSAEAEEALIACVLTVDEFEYDDNDLSLLIRHTRSMIDSFETGSTLRDGEPVDRSEDLARAGATIPGVLRASREEGHPIDNRGKDCKAGIPPSFLERNDSSPDGRAGSRSTSPGF